MFFNLLRYLYQFNFFKRIVPSILRKSSSIKKNHVLEVYNFKLNLSLNNSIEREIFLKKTYDQDRFEYLDKIMSNQKFDYFIDIGSYLGFYSIYFNKFKKIQNVVAFEPNLSNFKKLKNNIELNNSIITTFNIACSSEKKESKLWFHDINKTGGSSILSNEDREYIKYDKSTLTFETVQTNTLDNMLTNISNNIILVKIDVERHELDVLKGGKIFFSSNKVLLQIEIFQELKNKVFKYLIDQKFRYINSIDDDHYFTNY